MIHVILSKDHVSIVEAKNRDEAERNFNANWALNMWFDGDAFGHLNSNGMYPEPQYYVATNVRRDNGDRAIVGFGRLGNVRHEELLFLNAERLKKMYEKAMWQVNYNVSHGLGAYHIGDISIDE